MEFIKHINSKDNIHYESSSNLEDNRQDQFSPEERISDEFYLIFRKDTRLHYLKFILCKITELMLELPYPNQLQEVLIFLQFQENQYQPYFQSILKDFLKKLLLRDIQLEYNGCFFFLLKRIFEYCLSEGKTCFETIALFMEIFREVSEKKKSEKPSLQLQLRDFLLSYIESLFQDIRSNLEFLKLIQQYFLRKIEIQENKHLYQRFISNLRHLEQKNQESIDETTEVLLQEIYSFVMEYLGSENSRTEEEQTKYSSPMLESQ